MLGLVGLLAAMFSGMIADGMLGPLMKSSKDGQDDDDGEDGHVPDEDAGDRGDAGDLLDFAGPQSHAPETHDGPLHTGDDAGSSSEVHEDESASVPISTAQAQTPEPAPMWSAADIATAGASLAAVDALEWSDGPLDAAGIHALDNGVVTSGGPAPTPLTLAGGDGSDVLSGGAGDDTIRGGGGVDFLNGRGGNDVLDGGDGDDWMWGGDGDDVMSGGDGDDHMEGGDGDDTLIGGAGDDRLAGQEGNDSLVGGDGSDTLLGGGGSDTLDGGAGDDWLAGGYGSDELHGGPGHDTLDGGAGNDTIWAYDREYGDDADYVNGGDGDDVLHIGAGDHATGGAGHDSFVIHDGIADGHPGDQMATIADFDRNEDDIAVVYDPAIHPDPVLSLGAADDPADATLLLDGHPLALVVGGAGMDLSTLRLIAERVDLAA